MYAFHGAVKFSFTTGDPSIISDSRIHLIFTLFSLSELMFLPLSTFDLALTKGIGRTARFQSSVILPGPAKEVRGENELLSRDSSRYRLQFRI